MSGDSENTPVKGDGVITIDGSEEEEKTMAVDLPENVASQQLARMAGNQEANNSEARDLTTTALGVLKGAMARRHDELDSIESRANSGVMATPIASPATQTGS